MDDHRMRRLQMNMSKVLIGLAISLCVSATAMAEIQVAKVFGDNMVLQRDEQVTIWGWGTPGERLTLTINDQVFKGRVNKEGSWSVEIGEFPAGGPYEMEIKGLNSIKLQNVMFGEVWLCSGQSNMQYTLRMLGKDISKIPEVDNDLIRMLIVKVNADLLPAKDIKGGQWKMASKESVPDFSAVAYYFGKLLFDSLDVPIGLVNASLGATSIETWMSNETLKEFPQFSSIIDDRETVGKSISELDSDLANYRKTWDMEYYLVGPGLDDKWYDPDLDDSDWSTITNPNFWEYEGLDHDGAVWYRKEFDLPEGFVEDTFLLKLNQIDDYDIAWVNGVKVGETFGNRNWRNYNVPSDILLPTGNQVTVRVFDIGDLGGMHTSAFWGNPILNGEWKYKQGQPIDTDKFPKPNIANGSIFSYPGLLYNGNIAPLTKLNIKGVIWYQGEANAARAHEYRGLISALIKDWRSQWSRDLPFLMVQLANYGVEPMQPCPSNWAELREAQLAATDLPKVGLATAIDIGESADIHPKNKEEVGKRLGWQALTMVYGYQFLSESPRFNAAKFDQGIATLSFDYIGEGLMNVNKYGYIRGFQVAGEDQQFHWAKAQLIGNKIHVECDNVDNPVAVRYAWADDPGTLDIYNSQNLPLLTFRTDSWPLSTEGKVYNDTPHQF
ncbi:MAG: sialate O-acetylesterase [Cyclobacteriaceae bacterium]